MQYILILLTFLWSSDVFSMGVGFTSGSADEKWTDTNSFNLPESNYDSDSFGFVLDTNVAKNKLFNYRFTIKDEENSSEVGSIKYEGIAMTHDFGFGIIRAPHFRLWVGPRINIAIYDEVSIGNVRTSADIFGFAIGPVLGVNFHLPKVASFSITAGQVRGEYFGDINNSFNNNVFDVDVDYKSNFINFSVLFRFNDDYHARRHKRHRRH